MYTIMWGTARFSYRQSPTSMRNANILGFMDKLSDTKRITMISLLISSIFILCLFIQSLSYLYQSVNSQSDNDKFNNTSIFLQHYNPFALIKIEYPSLWQFSVIPDTNMTLFRSQDDSMGVMVQNKPASHLSINEINGNQTNYLQNNFLNFNILNSNISNSDDGSITETLIFNYGDDSSTQKELQITKTDEIRTLVFLYYAENSLFDRFLPVALKMLDSLEVSDFVKAFPLVINSNISRSSNESPMDTSATSGSTAGSIENNIRDDNENDKNASSGNFTTYDNKIVGLSIQ